MGLTARGCLRAAGFAATLIYTLIVLAFAWGIVATTVLRPPNQVHSGTDMIGMLGFLMFFGFVAASGVLAIIFAYHGGGVFKVLYFSGALAVLSAISFLPLSFVFNASVDFRPDVPDAQFLVGTWLDDCYRLELRPDRTYLLMAEKSGWFESDNLKYEGTWRMERNLVHFSNPDPLWRNPWEVTYSDGHYFMTYSIPSNFDAWTGNLGLMREEEWPRTESAKK